MPPDNDVQAVEQLSEAYRLITTQLERVIVGQTQVIEQLLVAMFARGHCLLVGVPGLAKTLMIRTLAERLNLDFSRIQFTPDLMPVGHHRHGSDPGRPHHRARGRSSFSRGRSSAT